MPVSLAAERAMILRKQRILPAVHQLPPGDCHIEAAGHAMANDVDSGAIVRNLEEHGLRLASEGMLRSSEPSRASPPNRLLDIRRFTIFLIAPRCHLSHCFLHSVKLESSSPTFTLSLFPQAYQLPGTSPSDHGLSVPAPSYVSLASSRPAITLCRKIFSLSISRPPRGLTLTLSYIRTSAVPVWTQRTLTLFHSPSAHRSRASAYPPPLPVWTMATETQNCALG
ncbi:hypothetical protein BC827DRAFT_1273686 [Russula dissimulans]|nr:hypothetical protein BC827DRAFT_1273686 [Russula dissimulans]